MNANCTGISRILAGRSAQTLLDSYADGTGFTPDRGAVVVLPTWAWCPPGVSVGRKTNTSGETLMPVRISWPDDISVVVVDENETLTLPWTAYGLGVRLSGSCEVKARISTPLNTAPHHAGRTGPGSRIEGEIVGGIEIEAALHQLVEDASTAKWTLLSAWERNVLQDVQKTNASMSYQVQQLATDVTGVKLPPGTVLDPHTLESVTATITYGHDGETTSPILELLNRVLDPATFVKVDPSRYVRTRIRQVAVLGVHRAAGETEVGARVRRLAIELSTDHVGEITAAYRKRHPADRMGEARVRAALELRPSRHVSLPDLDILGIADSRPGFGPPEQELGVA